MITNFKNNSKEENKKRINKKLNKLNLLKRNFKRNHLKLLHLLKNNSASINTLNDSKKYSLEIIKFVDNISKYLSLSNESISIIRKLSRSLNTILNNIDIDKKDILTDIKNYNQLEKNNLSVVLDNYTCINTFISDNANLLGSNIDHDIALSSALYSNENTLIISETENKVFLPYTLKDIQCYMIEHKNFNFDDVIQLKYTIPLSKYKNAVKSRFVEAYTLIRKKEHGSIKDALDLAFELAFNSNLHPAIITACKNLRELDIYLACLESNELDDFRFFKILFQIPPMPANETSSMVK